MLITTTDWYDLGYESTLYNQKNGTNLEPYEYVKQIYHARCENAEGPGKLELIFEEPKWESYYLMKRL